MNPPGLGQGSSKFSVFASYLKTCHHSHPHRRIWKRTLLNVRIHVLSQRRIAHGVAPIDQPLLQVVIHSLKSGRRLGESERTLKRAVERVI
jgi:hypothetical protein